MKIKIIGPVIGCLTSSFLVASNSFADGYFGSASAQVIQSDNGSKSTDNKIAELQEQYNLNLGASYENAIAKFEADYGASYRDFSENTQPSKSTLDGHAALQLGRPSQLAELLVEHSRQTLLNKPDSLDLTENQDEREVIAISPTLNWHFSSADTVFLKGNYSDIRYLETELNNSTRAGATLGILHRVTEVDSLGLNLQSTKVDFEYFPASNYTFRTAMLSYTAQLRQLSYSVQAGSSQSEEEEGKKYTMPAYLASLSFKSGVNTFALNIAQELTDTSFGGGNKNTSDGSPTSDGGISQSGQIQRKSADAQWTSTAFCDRCTVIMGAHLTRDNHLSINKDTDEVGVSLVGNYVLSHAAMLSLNLAQANHSLPGDTIGASYKSTTVKLEYSYRLGKSFHIKCSYGGEKRVDDNSATGYLEKLAGVSLGYSF